jgi:hypothetical protein
LEARGLVVLCPIVLQKKTKQTLHGLIVLAPTPFPVETNTLASSRITKETDRVLLLLPVEPYKKASGRIISSTIYAKHPNQNLNL